MSLAFNPSQTRKKSRDLLARYKACWRCGSLFGLSVHHDDKDRLNNEDTNVFVICSVCHGAIHGRDKKLGRDRHLVNLKLFTPEQWNELTIQPQNEPTDESNGGKIFVSGLEASPAKRKNGGKKKKYRDPISDFAAVTLFSNTGSEAEPP